MQPVHSENCQDQDCLILDVSGVLYCIIEETVLLIPEGLLKVLWDCSVNPDQKLPDGVLRTKQTNRFFLQRSPPLFDIVLQCYITGKIHVPDWVCSQTVQEEMVFWNLGSQYACSCCSDDHFDDDDEEIFEGGNMDDDAYPKTKWQMRKRAMWTFFQQPKSSRGATVFAVVVMTFVVISISNLVIGSIPRLYLCPQNATEVYSASQIDKVKESLETDLADFNDTLEQTNLTISFKPEGVLRFFSNCLGMQKFEMVDMICIGWFTVEISMRFVVCPNKLNFLMSPLNIIDILASFPFYVELLLWIFEVKPTALNYNLNKLFLLLRTVTVLRILKLARYSKDLRILGRTIRLAKNELGMLCLFVTVSTLIYASLVFQFERDAPDTKFVTIPASMWWAIATLTTVGFGDITPKTVPGKLMAGITCVTGIMIVALPVSVLVEHFTSAYKKRSKVKLCKVVAVKK